MNKTRRELLGWAGIASLGLISTSAWGQGGTSACYDPAALPLSQKNRRRALSYTDTSPDPKKRCAGCAFFTGTKEGCGTCQMLSGAPVDAGGVCTSFAPRG